MADVGRSTYGDIERGEAVTIGLVAWFRLAVVLGLPLRFEAGRDSMEPLADAGHLDLQQLVLRCGHAAGYVGTFELPTRSSDPSHSVDVHLLDKPGRRLVVTECWNTFGDLGASVRSSDRKRAEAEAAAVAFSPTDEPLVTGLVWVVRDTKRNRAIFERYRDVLDSKFTGSSAGWLRALTSRASPPTEPGIVWADVRATRIFARRR